MRDALNDSGFSPGIINDDNIPIDSEGFEVANTI
jgi:hypothetical protein